MSNDTTFMANGECVTKDGKKMMMKEGQFVEMGGKMDIFTMRNKTKKHKTKMKIKKHNMTVLYTCQMHPEVTIEKPGKCPKCGMTLVKKKE